MSILIPSLSSGGYDTNPSPLSTRQMLTEGGDARIVLDAHTNLNKYGCSPVPDPDLLAFGSSTASTISPRAFEAADNLWRKLSNRLCTESAASVYAGQIERIRRELRQLCEIEDDVDAIFAASGTDLHLIAAQLVGYSASVPPLAIMVGAEETGAGVQAALAGRHFSTRSALGASVVAGASIPGAAAIELATIPIRCEDGSPRNAADVDAEVEALVHAAAAVRRRILLIVADVTKTGMISPSIGCAIALRRKYPDGVDVLIDACQFRISGATLRAYLQNDFIVAVTGSKFLSGPTFSGALLVPPNVAKRLRKQALPRSLVAYSSRLDWSAGWKAQDALDEVANFGLLLRWEAALEELRAFRKVPENTIRHILELFAAAVTDRLRNDPAFSLLPVPAIDRSALIGEASWDQLPTIFSFCLNHPLSRGGEAFDREQVMAVYRKMPIDLTGRLSAAGDEREHSVFALRCQIGQPVACGERNGRAVSALRICASSRLIVEAAMHDGRNVPMLIQSAMSTLDKVVLITGNAI